jgi:Mg-chelatase subunit ChlD
MEAMRTNNLPWAFAAGLLLACGSDVSYRADATVDDEDPLTAVDGGTKGSDSGKPPKPGDDDDDDDTPAPIATRDGGDDEVCEKFMVPSRQVAPDLLIVLDRSGSMRPDGNEQRSDRWSGSVSAIIDVTAALDDKIRFGLMTFPAFTPGSGDGDDDDDSECAAGTVNVPLGMDSGGAIAMSLGAMNADGRTPTAASLRAALELFGEPTVSDAIVPPRYVLLVTDGDPNCSGQQTRGPDTAARQESIAAVEALRKASVKTYVVGYQTAGTEFSGQLDMMAAAGGTGEMMHRSVQSSTDLSAVLSQLAGEVASCTYALTKEVDDPKFVRVVVGSTPRNQDDLADGWTLGPDKKTIEIVGKACDDVRGGAQFDVIIECAPVGFF